MRTPASNVELLLSAARLPHLDLTVFPRRKYVVCWNQSRYSLSLTQKIPDEWESNHISLWWMSWNSTQTWNRRDTEGTTDLQFILVTCSFSRKHMCCVEILKSLLLLWHCGCIGTSLVFLLRHPLLLATQSSSSDGTWKSYISCYAANRDAQWQHWFLFYLCSSNVCIEAGAELLKKRLFKSPFCFLFHSRCQLNLYLSRFETGYVPCQPFSCTETSAKSKSSCYQNKYICDHTKMTASLKGARS